VETETPNQAPGRGPAPEAAVRSTLLRLLRLVAAEVVRRLLVQDDPKRDRPPRDI
jgi:hypothetical protein